MTGVCTPLARHSCTPFCPFSGSVRTPAREVCGPATAPVTGAGTGGALRAASLVAARRSAVDVHIVLRQLALTVRHPLGKLLLHLPLHFNNYAAAPALQGRGGAP